MHISMLQDDEYLYISILAYKIYVYNFVVCSHDSCPVGGEAVGQNIGVNIVRVSPRGGGNCLPFQTTHVTTKLD